MCLFRKRAHPGQRMHCPPESPQHKPWHTGGTQEEQSEPNTMQSRRTPAYGRNASSFCSLGCIMLPTKSLNIFHTSWARRWNETGGEGSVPGCGTNFHPNLTSIHFSELQCLIYQARKGLLWDMGKVMLITFQWPSGAIHQLFLFRQIWLCEISWKLTTKAVSN